MAPPDGADRLATTYRNNSLLTKSSTPFTICPVKYHLINRPEYAQLQAKLETRMRELVKKAGDPGDTDKIMTYRASRGPKSM